MRMRWSGKLAGLGVWLAAVAFAPAQAATITVEAIGKISACNDDGTLAALALGPCLSARVALTQTFEAGPNSAVDASSNPSFSFFGDAISSQIRFLDTLSTLSRSTTAGSSFDPGTGTGVMSIETAALPGTPASFSSEATQYGPAGLVLVTRMSFSGSAALISSANPNVAVIDLSSLPTDFFISFGGTMSSFPLNDPFDLTEVWSFTASGADVESMRFIREPGPLPEPATMALLLMALTSAAFFARRRNPHAQGL